MTLQFAREILKLLFRWQRPCTAECISDVGFTINLLGP